MRYYVISALINFALLLIPITVPILKAKQEEKNKKQVIVVNLQNSTLEEIRTKSTVDTDSDDESNGTAGLKRGNPESKDTSPINTLERQEIPKTPQPAPPQKQPPQTQPQLPKTQSPLPNVSPPARTETKEIPKTESKPVLPPSTTVSKSPQQILVPATTTKTANSKPSATSTAGSSSSSNSTVSSNSGISGNSGSQSGTSNSGTSHGSRNGNTANGSINGNKNGRGTGTSGNSTSSGHGKDKPSGSTQGGGCHEGRDFSVSYKETLSMPQGAERLNREYNIVVNVTVRFTRGGGISIVSASGGKEIFKNEAKRAAKQMRINFKTSNCSSGIVTKPFRFQKW